MYLTASWHCQICEGECVSQHWNLVKCLFWPQYNVICKMNWPSFCQQSLPNITHKQFYSCCAFLFNLSLLLSLLCWMNKLSMHNQLRHLWNRLNNSKLMIFYVQNFLWNVVNCHDFVHDPLQSFHLLIPILRTDTIQSYHYLTVQEQYLYWTFAKIWSMIEVINNLKKSNIISCTNCEVRCWVRNLLTVEWIQLKKNGYHVFVKLVGNAFVSVLF